MLLCRLVGTLERRKVEGIDEHPRSSASALHNIRKALDVLKGKKAVPMRYLYAEEEVFRGNREVVLGLLDAIRAAYPTSMATPTKTTYSFCHIDRSNISASYWRKSEASSGTKSKEKIAGRREQGLLYRTFSGN